MSVRPVRDLLYIIPLEPEVVLSSGLIIPETARKRVNQGIVKYRGPQTSGDIRVGDHVFFAGYSGDELIIEEEGKLILIPESFIEAVVFDEEEDETERVFTLQQVKMHLDDAFHICTVQLNEHDKEVAKDLAKRIKEHLDGLFYRELYF